MKTLIKIKQIKLNNWLSVLINWLKKIVLKYNRKEKYYYCQNQIEGGKFCKTQCDHCNEYYQPLELEKRTGMVQNPLFIKGKLS